MNRTIGSIVAVIAAGVVLAGCSQKEGSAPAAAGAQPAKAKQIKLAGIVFQEDQFFRLVSFGMRDAAKKAGVELLEGNSAMKPEKEIQVDGHTLYFWTIPARATSRPN